MLRLKRARDLDATTAAVFVDMNQRVRSRGGHLLLVGMRGTMMTRLERTGAAADIGEDNLFPTEPQWFRAMDRAIERALELVGDHSGHAPCALEDYARRRRKVREGGTVPMRAVGSGPLV